MFKETISTVTLSPQEMAALAQNPNTATIEQRSDEWRNCRVGCATASRIGDVMAKTKSRGGESEARTGNVKNGYSASRATYMAELLLERLTGKPAKSFTSAAIQHGIDTEPQARATYELFTGNTVIEAGFHIHPKIAMTGASPDGLIEPDGLLEIKCPQPPAHLDILDKRKVPNRYLLQMQWQMACTGAKWCDFVSFNPDFPAPLDMFLTRVPRDNALIADMELEVQAFLHELEAKFIKLKEQTHV